MSLVMTGLPPDLARLGDELNASVERAVRRRRARRELLRRILPAGLVGAMTVVAVTPDALGPSQRQMRAVATPSPVAAGAFPTALVPDSRITVLATTTDAAWLEAEDPFQPAIGQ
jgi:hypothetical protein